ncbi:hypothetical protein BpHYR1_052720 [Brachionus plicatilis]|uniref:Uncharacterized protein n=1 Tax=Brachionus plicatilis TaxID=10195 RepID=A0A3M7SKA9_BRAPC|nr:hypothetical protein BpHYR1_052720 [Brachionus plicatilis]
MRLNKERNRLKLSRLNNLITGSGYHTGCRHPSRYASFCMQIATCSLPLITTTTNIDRSHLLLNIGLQKNKVNFSIRKLFLNIFPITNNDPVTKRISLNKSHCQKKFTQKPKMGFLNPLTLLNR